IRYCPWSPGASPAPPAQTAPYRSNTAPTTDVSRPSAWATSRRRWRWSTTARPYDVAGVRGSVLRERLRRRAGAHEVAVAVRLVDAGDRRPVLVGVDALRE